MFVSLYFVHLATQRHYCSWLVVFVYFVLLAGLNDHSISVWGLQGDKRMVGGTEAVIPSWAVSIGIVFAMGESVVAKLCTRTTCHGPLDFYQSRGYGRLFWWLITLGSFVAVGYYGYQMTVQFLQGQSATSISDVSTDRMKFPNVTICSPLRHNTTWIMDNVHIPPVYVTMIQADTGLNEEQFKKEFTRYLRILSFGLEVYNQNEPGARKLVQYLETLYQYMFNGSSSAQSLNMDINQFLVQAAFDCPQYLVSCTFDQMPFNCCDDQYIRRTFSDNGYCYTIDVSGNATFAYQTSKGEDFGLEVIVEMNMDNTYILSTAEEVGLRIHVGDYATTFDANPIGVPPDIHAHIQIKSSHYILDQNIDNCLQNGKDLPGFEAYTKKNCEMSCFEDICTDLMGCGFATGVLERDSKTLCSPLTILQQLIPRMIGDTSDSQSYRDALVNCFNTKCPKLCDYWEYTTYVMYSEMTNDTQSNSTPIAVNNTHITKISVYYSDLEYQEYQNQLLTDTNTFVSNLGGIVGLWTGISIISIVQCLAIMIFGPCEDNPGCCGCTKKKT